MPNELPGTPQVVGPRIGRARRRSRGEPRGPLVLRGPLTPPGHALGPSRRDEFDALVLATVQRLARRWSKEWGDVEFATEDLPQLEADWVDEPVPLGALVRGSDAVPDRIVIFRRPIESRARSRHDRSDLVLEALAETVAELLGRDPAEILEL